MRLKLMFKVNSKIIPLDYRRMFISFFKYSLGNYDKEVLEKYYKKKDPILKDFTFSVFMKNCEFHKNFIQLETNFINLFFSTYSYETLIYFYNAFVNMISHEFNYKETRLELYNILKIPSKNIESNLITVKTLSPILIRNHTRQSDEYLYFSEEGAIDILKKNTHYQLKKIFVMDNSEFDIEILKLKKVTVMNYNKKLRANLGIFRIKSEKKVLEFLYRSGIGSKRSSGFGMIEIL
ncbi:CRISPR-associated endoribonuclease Cas6 [Thermosipho atlanticus]|uniref:CRISPR-associated endoribonuclease Cas6 n=1 Tax=Thermosipho atlanticus DSM 15807 TaxID=1123380 RepID=A0A1M5U4I4_9BACT|nr:CRISPR-associated endoribonuclease Cas6 [Thermosipho atlanticus]SHH57790.1 CRISPR-associated endoribonuclease Cas6 [Thermosipho atlanticus DSM 15807]